MTCLTGNPNRTGPSCEQNGSYYTQKRNLQNVRIRAAKRARPPSTIIVMRIFRCSQTCGAAKHRIIKPLQKYSFWSTWTGANRWYMRHYYLRDWHFGSHSLNFWQVDICYCKSSGQSIYRKKKLSYNQKTMQVALYCKTCSTYCIVNIE